jgi:hypothetical protein
MNKCKLVYNWNDFLRNPKKTLNNVMLELRNDNQDHIYVVKKENNVIINLTAEESVGFTDTYRLYGKIVGNELYIARYEYIPAFPDIDVYSEFITTGQEIKF